MSEKQPYRYDYTRLDKFLQSKKSAGMCRSLSAR
jgi:hypothetical protein